MRRFSQISTVLMLIALFSLHLRAGANECESQFVSFDEAVASVHWDLTMQDDGPPPTALEFATHKDPDASKLRSDRSISSVIPRGVVETVRGYVRFLESKRPDHAALFTGSHYQRSPTVGLIFQEGTGEVVEGLITLVRDFPEITVDPPRPTTGLHLRRFLENAIFGHVDSSPVLSFAKLEPNRILRSYLAESYLISVLLRQRHPSGSTFGIDIAAVRSHPDYADEVARLRRYFALIDQGGEGAIRPARVLVDMPSLGYGQDWLEMPVTAAIMRDIADRPGRLLDVTLFWDPEHVIELTGEQIRAYGLSD